ncbi:MAG TPA: Gfo/Idh/MocA family oxidoreductase [Vicinamibacterales bacterium]
MEEKKAGVTRREFIGTAAATGAALTVVPRHVLGRGFTPPSDLLNIACVGIGGMGRNNMRAVASQNIVAICDIDWDYAGQSVERFTMDLERRLSPQTSSGRQNRGEEVVHDPARAGEPVDVLQRLVDQLPKAKRYTDYREMLQQQKDIDAVIVATPDHMHATIASAAMDLGKHVYVQKPLTWSVEEARHLARQAKEKKVATQMGNQGHSAAESRMTVEYIQQGAIGDVHEVHVWTNRPLGYWPQGLPRPSAAAAMTKDGKPLPWNGAGVEKRLAAAMAGNYPVPDTLKWDLFIGGSSVVEYHPVYHPFNWRGWVDWGQGALGDMGAHLIDFPFWSLELGMPTSVETISTPFNDLCYPHATTTYYEFAGRGNMPPVKLTWYDGGLLPPRPAEFSDEIIEHNGRKQYKEQVNPDGGVMYIGTKGKLMHETYGYKPQLLPHSLQDSFGKPKETLPRIQTTHEMNWVEAAKGNTQASSPFEYAARLVEVMLLGVVSLRARSKIYYDAEKMQITNISTANDYLKRNYRQGWKLT